MKILLTGKDDFTYNRTRVLIAGLERLPGIELIYFPIQTRRHFDRKKFTKLSSECDLIYIPPFRHSDVKFIKKYAVCPVVFDALISKYLTRTIDHGKWWTAWEKSARDRIAFKQSDYILMDTEAHRKYIIERYKLDPECVLALPVGVDTNLFKPQSVNTQKDVFTVGFYGGFIPLQGVDKIVEAANLLKEHADIRFEIIGKGPRYKNVMALAKKLDSQNINFLGWVPYEELNNRINSFDLCLGIFGDSLKADLVVPNKLYHYSAMQKCTITKDTVGIREVFEPAENIVLTYNNSESIAKSILSIKMDNVKRKVIAENAYVLMQTKYNQDQIAQRFLDFFINHRN
ncbi:MAG: glycosyltransferase involved in cell wall biosynthesis [Cyclobacteriaceae bacterium]|jgi:glycosyltransferase involved in cell wall biosynthesis